MPETLKAEPVGIARLRALVENVDERWWRNKTSVHTMAEQVLVDTFRVDLGEIKAALAAVLADLPAPVSGWQPMVENDQFNKKPDLVTYGKDVVWWSGVPSCGCDINGPCPAHRPLPALDPAMRGELVAAQCARVELLDGNGEMTYRIELRGGPLREMKDMLLALPEPPA